MAVEKFAGIYFDKNQHFKVYAEGHHAVATGGGSLRIAEGYMVRFYENEDTSGTPSRVLYAGEYEDLTQYSGVVGSKRFDIEKVDIKNDEIVTAIDYVDVGTGTPYPRKYGIPPGTHDCHGNWFDNLFPDNRIDALNVPAGLSVQVYDRADKPFHLTFDGPQLVDLGRHGYSNKVSKIEVMSDEWQVTEDVVDWDNAKELSRTRINAASARIRNRSAAELTDTHTLRYTQENTYSRTWEVGGSITAGMSVEAEGGVPLVGKVTATVSVEATVSASGGGTDQTRTMEEKERSLQVTAPPHSEFDLIAVYDKIKSEIPTYRVLKNKRTGAELRQETTLIAFEGEEATITTQDVE